MHVSHVAVLKDDTEDRELLVEVLNHGAGHVALEVEHLREPDAINEVPNALVNLSVEHLIKPTCAKLVDEVLDFLLSTRHAEREVKVHANVGVVLRRAVMDWGIVVDDRLGNHASDSASAAVAPLGTWLHHTCASAAALLESGETSRDIELEVAAAA